MKREAIDIKNSSFYYFRTKVPWGWIVECVGDVMEKNMESGYQWRPSITFVFDPFHWWKIK